MLSTSIYRSTPIYDVVQPPPCRSSAGSIAFHHSQQHSLDQSDVIHSEDVAEKFEVSLLYQVHHCAVPLYFFLVLLLILSFHSADVQYSPVTPHLEGQQLSLSMLHWHIEQTRKHDTRETSK